MCDKFLKSMMYEVYSTTKKEIGIVDENKKIINYVGEKELSYLEKLFEENFIPNQKSNIVLNYIYTTLKIKPNKNFFLFTENKCKEDFNQLELIKILIENVYSKENYIDKKESFIKEILTNDIYESEIEKKAEKLNIKLKKNMVVILIETEEQFYDEVKNFLKEEIKENKEFLVELENNSLAILKTDLNTKEDKLIIKYAEKIYNRQEGKIRIAIGSFVENLREIARSLREAKIAMDVEKIFKNFNEIAIYNKLGIERIIYKLPFSICEIFLSEVLGKNKIKTLEQETLFTIDRFFENNLNISETSRKLFIHRNTLVYRLEKIKNQTGLDLRLFDDAAKFKIALMIQKYINFTTEKETKI